MLLSSSYRFIKRFIRGPTHNTRTDVWVSRGDTLSLFKRRGEKGIGLVVVARERQKVLMKLKSPYSRYSRLITPPRV